MRNEVREKVGQYSEQCQAGNSVGGENPRSAAFMLPHGSCSSRGLLGVGRGDDRGPIFHAKPPTERSWRKYVMRHASLASWRSRNYLSGILLRIGALAAQKCDRNHSINMQIYLHAMIISPSPNTTSPIFGSKCSRFAFTELPFLSRFSRIAFPRRRPYPPLHGIITRFS
jgi:hypothetical protein